MWFYIIVDGFSPLLSMYLRLDLEAKQGKTEIRG